MGFIVIFDDLWPKLVNCLFVCLFVYCIVTGSSYLHPPGDMPYLSPQKESRSKYRYLDSNGALLKSPLWPKPSETKVNGTFLTNSLLQVYFFCIFLSSMFFFFLMMLPITRLSWRLMHMVHDINPVLHGCRGKVHV